jgi:hypothetical protein
MNWNKVKIIEDLGLDPKTGARLLPQKTWTDTRIEFFWRDEPLAEPIPEAYEYRIVVHKKHDTLFDFSHTSTLVQTYPQLVKIVRSLVAESDLIQGTGSHHFDALAKEMGWPVVER